MRSLFLLAALAALAPRTAPPDWKEIRGRAERLYAEGSYELAHRAYDEASTLELAPEDRRWLLFRLADTDWRSAAATDNPDSTRIERAKSALDALQRKVERPEQRDEVWADAEESLGDFEWLRRESQNLSAAMPHYQMALDFWAGARDVEKARGRWLPIAFRMAWPGRGDWTQNYWAGQIPAEIGSSAMKIAVSDGDRAQAALLYALIVRQRGADLSELQRGLEALEQAISLGRETPWLDDALWLAAQWYENQGAPSVQEDGTWTQKPDYPKALALYRRIVAEFPKGRSRWHDAAASSVARILEPGATVAVGQAFLPGSEVGYQLSWRNVAKVELALYPVDLARAVAFAGRKEDSTSQWLATIDLSKPEKVLGWTFDTKDDGQHRPGSAELRVERKLDPGAYVLEARAGSVRSRDIVLVSSTSLFLKCSGDQVLAWVVDATTSEPVAGADVAIWERFHDGSRWIWRIERLTTGEDGTALARRAGRENGAEIFVAATKGGRSAFALGGTYGYRRNEADWRLYAFTDRSTYRPGGTVQWKLVARTRREGSYSTPAGARLEYEIADPKGAVVGKGSLALSAFGSASATFETNGSLALGEYRVSFFEPASPGRRGIGGATLFRLEEYKLPEFEVKVDTSSAGGAKKLWRLGDRVEALVLASMYSGAPVANADVEVLVRQRPTWRPWIPEHDYPWLYSDSGLRYGNPYGEGQVVSRLALKTDAEGRAPFSFDTPKGAGSDLEFAIEARVVDASRREIRGQGRVRVARLAYSVRASTPHNVHRPGDRVEVRFQAEDANGEPVSAEGRVTVVRNRWVEVWIDPGGKEVRGPHAETQGDRWQAKFRGYETEEVAASSLRTDAKGAASFTFAAAAEGYYTATWLSRDDRAGPIEASIATWVAAGSTAELGYHAGGLELVVDRDTFRVGETAPVLLCTPESNRWVLFSVESEALHSFQVVHVEGTAKLVMLPVTAEHVPNVYLSALTTSDGDALSDVKEVVVPPVEQFLSVEVAPDRGEILPGGEGTLSVRVRDHKGEPVAAEIALALVDDSVSAIQGEYAGDPRQFFFGERRGVWVRTQSSFEQKRYARLVRGENGLLRDELDSRRQTGAGGKEGFRSGLRGRELGQLAMDGAAPASKAANAVEESVEKKSERSDDKDSESAVQVRSDFRETALWEPAIATDGKGEATVHVKYPESLTRWKATARVAAADARFGIGTAATRTQKPLAARLECPRFFVVGDEVTISGLFDNRTQEALRVKPALSAEGLDLVSDAPGSLEIPAGGQARVDWRARVVVAGTAKLRLTARAGELQDGMEKVFAMEPHGIDALVARAVKMKGDEIDFALDVPAARRRETTRMLVQVAPSLAVTMLDALPYLVDYPYGCTEQTLSRFLPAAIVAKTLKDAGLSPEAAMSRVFGGIEPDTAGATHTKGKRSLDELDRIVRTGLDRLYDFQHPDGGWAWWKEGASDPFMTAYVVWGLSLARDAGVDVRNGVIERGAGWLSLEIVKAESEQDLEAWMLHALAVSGHGKGDDRTKVAFEKLWKDRDGLNAYSRALFCLAAKKLGRDDAARTLAQNLANGVQRDETPDVSRVDPKVGMAHEGAMKTAHWGADRMWRRWSEGPVETTAFALRALLAVEPTSPLAEEAASWLVQNRRGAQWSNTRDTAIAVLAVDDWLARSGEIARDVEYELAVNGKVVARKKIGAAEMLSAPADFPIPSGDVRDGRNDVRLRRISGEGPLYLAARASFFSQEEPVPARGNEIFVKRQYWKLVGRPTLLKGQVYDRVPLEDGGSVASGERVEVVLSVEAKNDLEYLLFEDLKPAGLEAVELKSGEPCFARELKSGEVERRAETADPLDGARYTSRQRSLHQEFRDRKVAFFADKLPQGVWEIRYDLRAEVPGKFHALPTLGEAMYVPEIRCNGAETRLTVTEREAQGE
jgi:uncharacterized protein YfaS (alpha-2-macroglobulin family)